MRRAVVIWARLVRKGPVSELAIITLELALTNKAKQHRAGQNKHEMKQKGSVLRTGDQAGWLSGARPDKQEQISSAPTIGYIDSSVWRRLESAPPDKQVAWASFQG